MSFLLALLAVHPVLQAQKNLMLFKVSNNAMNIVVSKDVPLAKVDSFIHKFNLGDIGIYSLLHKGTDDSLILTGWKVYRDDSIFAITKTLGSAGAIDPGNAIFTPVPTNEDWRIVGGNRVVYGVNSFKESKEFRQENGAVYFHLQGFTNARNVRLAGNFTNWQYGAFPMKRDKDGWTVAVQLPPGQYFYKFIVDDGWMTDPLNQLSENDGRGNENSVLYVSNRRFFLKGYLQADQVFVTGNFSNWAGSRLRMKKSADGWYLDMFLEPGTWSYTYIVDGKMVRADGQAITSVGDAYIFRLKGYENAREVILAGEFNDWDEHQAKMQKESGGWSIPFVLGPGNYQYKFIVDGDWITDPANATIVNDGKGNQNSFVVVDGNYTFRLKGYENARHVSLSGDFANWSPDGLLMKREGSDWVIRLYLSKGKHVYRYNVDGKWILDPSNKYWEESDDRKGNSVLWLEAEVKQLQESVTKPD